MGTLTATQNTGYALVEQWKFSMSKSGLSGTRVYLDTDSVLPNSTKESIPKLGDSWSDDYLDLICSNVDVTYLNDSDQCGKKVVCTFSGLTTPQDKDPVSEDDSPKYVDVNGEFISFEPKDDAIYWEDGGATDFVKQPLYFSVGRATIRLFRVIKTFDEYMRIVFTEVNKVNNSDFLGFPAGMVLFTGADATEFRDRIGRKRWNVELSCAVRSVTGVFAADMDGWNYVLNEKTALWDRPLKVADDSATYESTNFDTIFTGDPLGDDQDLYIIYPDQ